MTHIVDLKWQNRLKLGTDKPKLFYKDVEFVDIHVVNRMCQVRILTETARTMLTTMKLTANRTLIRRTLIIRETISIYMASTQDREELTTGKTYLLVLCSFCLVWYSCCRDVHRVQEKKRPQYSSHNFDKFKHSFVIFGTNHPDNLAY